jgi:hypothetical protein
MAGNRRLNDDTDLRVEVVQKLLADPVCGPASAVFLRPAKGEFLALCTVNKTAVRSHVPSFPSLISSGFQLSSGIAAVPASAVGPDEYKKTNSHSIISRRSE